jgi:hypothetical protein
VKLKLLDGKLELEEKDDSGSLACLSMQFSLEFDMASNFREVACKQVEHHMWLCLTATTGCETLITFSRSKPLLAEVASQLMCQSMVNPVHHLANHSDLHCVNCEQRGELVAVLILMQAHDKAVMMQLSLERTRWAFVGSFLKALLPEMNYKALEHKRMTSWHNGEDKPFMETFEDYAMWFNHVIRVHQDTLVNAKYLWRFITCGVMIICAHNQPGVDIIIPLCLKTERLSPKTMSAILIQVKNTSKYGNQINTKLFDKLCPFKLCMFDEDATPRPIIRMIFALASQESKVQFQEVDKTCNKFTAFDIWCVGLSCFPSIGEDLASYQVLLDRLLEPQHAFILGELAKDKHLLNETKRLRGLWRWRIAALTMDNDGHHCLHL